MKILDATTGFFVFKFQLCSLGERQDLLGAQLPQLQDRVVTVMV